METVFRRKPPDPARILQKGRDADAVAFPAPELHVRYDRFMPLLAKLVAEVVLRFKFRYDGMRV